MDGAYTRLTPISLARIFQPEQHLKVTLNSVTDANGEKAPRTFEATILKLESDQLFVTLTNPSLDELQLFRTGRVVTIETGCAGGVFTFKSKIISKRTADANIGIECPKVLASKERRRSPRANLTVPVVYKVIGFNDRKIKHLSEKVGIGESRELAQGGLTFFTDLSLPVGLVVVVEFHLEGASLSIAGVVQRSIATDNTNRHFNVGIKFINPEAAYQKIILHTIKKSKENPHMNMSL